MAIRFLFPLLSLAAVSACVSGRPDPSISERQLDRIIERSLTATGGESALSGLRNLRLKAAWTEMGTAFTGDYRATRDGLMRIDVSVDGKRVFSEGIDSRGPWEQKGPDAPATPVGPEAGNALRHGIEYRFNGIWLARERGNKVSHAGREVIDGVDYHVIKLTLRDGFESYFYVNPATWLVERQRDTRAYHPSLDRTKVRIENVFDQHVARCGVKMPSRQQDRDVGAGKILSSSRVVEGTCNVPFATLDIDRPS
jgi:hypothetical protein